MQIRIVKMFTTAFHGGSRTLGQLKGLVLHETEGHNGGDYTVLSGRGTREVSVHYWIPDYNDPGAEQYIHGDVYDVFQFIPLTTVGWSVGSAIQGWSNSETVSIEMGNYGDEPYPESQLIALDLLIAEIDTVLGRELPIKSHKEIALPAGRKSDPGPSFPLANYQNTRSHYADERPTLPPKPIPRVNVPAYPGHLTKRGDRNSHVTKIQGRLRQRGWKISVDSIFGRETERVVKKFQQEKKLVVDGVVGPATWRALWT